MVGEMESRGKNKEGVLQTPSKRGHGVVNLSDLTLQGFKQEA